MHLTVNQAPSGYAGSNPALRIITSARLPVRSPERSRSGRRKFFNHMQYKKLIFSIIILVLVVVVGAIVYYFIPPLRYWTQSPTSFEECKEAKGRVWHTNRVWCEFRGQTFEEKSLKIGAVEDVDVQSPHPYPNGSGIKSLVWSQTVTHAGATFLHLHFARLEVKGEIKTPTIFQTVDYGPCEPTSQNKQPVEQKPGEVSVGQLMTPKQCGLVQEKKQFTPQEILDNNYVSGDFIVIRDKQSRTLDVLVEKPLADGWFRTYETDSITVELYADTSANDYGVAIDKYSRGFTDE